MGGIRKKRDLDGTRLPPGLPCDCGPPGGGAGSDGNDVWAAAVTARPPNGLCPGLNE